MPKPTDSAVIEYNDDGSRTITTVETIYPTTKKDLAQGALIVAGGFLLTVAPFAAIAAIEKVEEKLADRKAAKNAEK